MPGGILHAKHGAPTAISVFPSGGQSYKPAKLEMGQVL